MFMVVMIDALWRWGGGGEGLNAHLDQFSNEAF